MTLCADSRRQACPSVSSIGRTGSGKTTLVNALVSLVPLPAGAGVSRTSRPAPEHPHLLVMAARPAKYAPLPQLTDVPTLNGQHGWPCLAGPDPGTGQSS